MKARRVNRITSETANVNSLARTGKDAVNYQDMVDFIAAQPVDGVASVTAGTGLTATPNPVIETGTIELSDTGVTPGSYNFADLTVDQQGRVSNAASGSPTFPMIFNAYIASTRYFGGDGNAAFGFFAQGLPMDATLIAVYVSCEFPPGVGEFYSYEFGEVPVVSITETDRVASVTGLSTVYSEGTFLSARATYSPGADSTAQMMTLAAVFTPN